MAFQALLDANVLHPMALCDTLIRVSGTGLYRARWTLSITTEVVNSLMRRRADLSRDRLERRVALMNEAVPNAEITGYEVLASALASELADPDDAHVIAAAIIAKVDVIVTSNVRDFTHPMLADCGIEIKTPDEFLIDMYWLNPDAVIRVMRQQAASTRRPPLSLDDVLARLAPTAPAFVSLVGHHVQFDANQETDLG